jgi:predicted nucleotidyltransferase
MAIGDQPDRERVLSLLSALAPELRRRFNVAHLALFGSVARGVPAPSSDVDLLVEFDGRPTFDDFIGLKLELEEALGRRVDLVTPDAMRPRMRKVIEQDLIHVA